LSSSVEKANRRDLKFKLSGVVSHYSNIAVIEVNASLGFDLYRNSILAPAVRCNSVSTEFSMLLLPGGILPEEWQPSLYLG
jgi:hypothetical protein